ncbi:MAG: hypothetical protein M0R70_12745 [Nitrospirae bacterium]|nr:hypothetical protein [Nitrospirota bacterium]
MSKETISDRQRVREELDWILDLKRREVEQVMKSQTNRGEDLSMKMIYEDCGIETCIKLWRKLPRISLHISERPLNELRRLYVRQHFNAEDPDNCIKTLAIKLGVSEQFVYEALGADEKEDPRQMKLLKDDGR